MTDETPVPVRAIVDGADDPPPSDPMTAGAKPHTGSSSCSSRHRLGYAKVSVVVYCGCSARRGC
jgi:hypothetical protein